MYGIIGRINALHGRRDELIEILLEGTTHMPGCLSYVVARDLLDDDGIWITEVWSDETAHKASLNLISVQDAIARGRPLIKDFGDRFMTMPMGGQGLPAF